MVALSEVSFGARLVRDGSFSYTTFPATELPGSLCYAAGEKLIDVVNNNRCVQAVITTEAWADRVSPEKGVIVTADPAAHYYRIHDYLVRDRQISLVPHPFISSRATIHSSVEIKGNVIIEDDVLIERDVIIEPGTILRKGVTVGNRVIIGAKGMQNLKVDGRFIRIGYGGGVEVGANTEVLDNAIIQRPYNFLWTRIGENCKISVKVSVGHGSQIGNNTMLAGNTQVAGNVTIGNDVWIGPSVTIADGLRIGDNAKVLLCSAVANHIPAGMTVSGNFALDHSKQLRNFAKIKKM